MGRNWCTRRMLPVTLLQWGGVSIEHKVEAHIWQTALDYGRDLSSVRDICDDTRAVLTDMGTEFGIADSGDVVPHVLGHATAPPQQWLFPAALKVPGFKHIIDVCLVNTLSQMTAWPLVLGRFKSIVQWLNMQRKRAVLQSHVRKLASDRGDSESVADALDKSVTAFTDWRWASLWDCLRDILRVEAPLTYFIAHTPLPGGVCNFFGTGP